MASPVGPTLIAVLLAIGASTGVSGTPQSKASRVDLVQTQLVAPGKITVGKAFAVRDEVENQGGSMAFESVTGFYLSVDDVLDDSDIVIGARRVPQLGADQTHTNTTPITLKVDVKPGEYYLLAVADAKKQLEERTRENNVRAVRITVLADARKKIAAMH